MKELGIKNSFGENCQTCKYAVRHESDGCIYCHRFPPYIGASLSVAWPPVGNYDWCGEWNHSKEIMARREELEEELERKCYNEACGD